MEDRIGDRASRRRRVGGLWLAAIAALGVGDAAARVRWDAPAGRIVVSGGVVTLSQIKAAVPDAPLERVDILNKTWHLGADLVLEGGATLRVHGGRIGGDASELRLKSENQPGAGQFVSITADPGRIDLRATRVLSWDSAENGPDVEHGTFGRAFVRVRSRLVKQQYVRESRMDVIDSEVAWLGHGADESYGLVWKVASSDPDVLGRVAVHGDVLRSHIHHNFFGLFAYGCRRVQWRDNEIAWNAQYGMEPSTGCDDVRIEGNDIHHNGRHGIMVTKRSQRALIRDNRARDNAGSGIVVHRHSDHAVVEGNHVYRNAESGIAVMASAGVKVRNNVAVANAIAGLRVALAASQAQVTGNQVSASGRYGIWLDRGGSTASEYPDPRPRNNLFSGNRVIGAGRHGVRVSEGLDNRFLNNIFLASGWREKSAKERASFVDNVFAMDIGAGRGPGTTAGEFAELAMPIAAGGTAATSSEPLRN